MDYINDGRALFKEGKYAEAAKAYEGAIEINGGKGLYYNTACSWALAGDTILPIKYLLLSAEAGWKDLDHLITDEDLNSLHQLKDWQNVVTAVQANLTEYQKDFDMELVSILDTVHREDQTLRKQIGDIQEKYGQDSDEMKAHWNLINEKDSLNLIKVKKILDEKGWLGADVIGGRGNMTLFLVIQHADIETQLKYLPMMREAVEKGNARASGLALLEDRIAFRQGKRQVYGSQIGTDPETGENYVLPLADPDNVDQRRAEVGLGPLADYVSRWNIIWDSEEYKKKLPELEKIE